MEQGYSLFNPGGSLNFEMPGSFIQQDNEEDEAAEDERIKEKELQALLTNAFDDLIEDDDEGSQMHSPTQNSIHSDSNTSVNCAFTGNEKRQQITVPSFGCLPADIRYTSQQQNAGSEETNGGFQQMEPETYDSEASGECDRSSRNLHGNPADSDWEGRYYVDHWDGLSDDQIQSGPLDDITKSAQNENFKQLPSKAQVNNQQRIHAYHPFNIEMNGQKTVEYKPQIEEKTDHLMQKHFLAVDGQTSDEIKLQQLQILYNARGREVHRLQQHLVNVMDERKNEAGALQQQLVTFKKEAEKNTANFQRYQKELGLANDAISKLEGQLRATEMQLSSVTANRSEVVQKLQAAESTIESLHIQIEELQNSENLNRARQNHAAMLASLKENHNLETYKLKVEIDDTKEALLVKEEEVEKLMEKLNKVSAECEKIQLDKAESVNRLLAALDESQKECQKLISAKALPTVINQQSDNKNDEIVQSLKNELASAKQELHLYVSASNLGIGTQHKDQTNKCVSLEHPSQDSLLAALKIEVERSLNCLQIKNDQLQKAHSNYEDAAKQLKAVREELDVARNNYSQAQLKIIELNKELQVMKKDAEMSDQSKEMEIIKKKIQEKDVELNQAKQHIEQLLTSNKQLTAMISKLKDEIKQLLQLHDEDKLAALNDCQDACLQLHSDAMKVKQNDWEQQLKRLQNENENEMNALIHELDEVKSLYVKVCEEKNELEKFMEEWKLQKQQEINDITKTCTSLAEQNKDMRDDFEEKLKLAGQQRIDFNEELLKTKVQNLVSKQVADNLKQAKKMWLKEQELEMKEKMSAKAKELLELHMSEKGHDHYDAAIEEYLEQIQELEMRVKETESLYKQNLVDLKKDMDHQKEKELKHLEEKLFKEREMLIDELTACKDREMKAVLDEMEVRCLTEKQKLMKELKEAKVVHATESLKNHLNSFNSAAMQQHIGDLIKKFEIEKKAALEEAAVKAEEEKHRAIAELEIKKELLLKEKLEAVHLLKEKEKEVALIKKEEQLCMELEGFLGQQKERFLMALTTMQERHNKEKAELEQLYETKISQLREEFKQSIESYQRDVNQPDHWQQNEVLQERNELKKLVKVLEDKCKQIETDMLNTITGLNLQLKVKDVKVEEEIKKHEELTSAFTTLQETSNRLRNEVAELKIKVQLGDETENNYSNLLSKYTALKEKVKRYHRYIHMKEKEFAVNLAKLTEEHKSALEKVESMKYEVTLIMNKKLDEMQFNVIQALLNRGLPRTVKQTTSSEMPSDVQDDAMDNKLLEMENACIAANLKDWFSKLINKIHADTVQYFEECNRHASAKIQEEVAKASWLLSEHVRNPSVCGKKDTMGSDVPVKLREHVTSYGSQSHTATPESLTNTSSGRGTMVGVPSSSLPSNPDAASHAQTQTLENEFGLNEPNSLIHPIKIWSSTPFMPGFASGSKWPIVQPSPELGKGEILAQQARIQASGSIIHPSTLLQYKPHNSFEYCNVATTTPRPNMLPAYASVSDRDSRGNTIPERLCPVERGTFHSSVQQASRQSEQRPLRALESEKRKTHFVDFSNNLTSLKTDFWSSIHESENGVIRNIEGPIK